MKCFAFAVLAAAVAALVPDLAIAKGPVEATVEGPGLGTPIQFGDWSNWRDEDAMAPHQPIMQLAEATGFFPAAFGAMSFDDGDPRTEVQNPMLAGRPEGNLGPRFVIRYRVPGPGNDEFRVLQYLYPYAKPSPLTYMPAGQPLFHSSEGTSGGWYAATNTAVPPLLTQLTDAGLPQSPPTVGAESSEFPWTTVGALAVAAGLLCLAALAVILVRRAPAARGRDATHP